jgi:hypothetical protein
MALRFRRRRCLILSRRNCLMSQLFTLYTVYKIKTENEPGRESETKPQQNDLQP